MRWGRLILLALAILPIFIFFMCTDARNDGLILASISTALYIGILASMMTTEKYTARSLGLFAAILGSAIYFTFLYLVYAKGETHEWMPNLTRAMFTIGAPMFAISTVVALIQRTHHRRDERAVEQETEQQRQQSELIT
jgi:Cu/Ag efflux pump CusA